MLPLLVDNLEHDLIIIALIVAIIVGLVWLFLHIRR
jgi:hypothetical protein